MDLVPIFCSVCGCRIGWNDENYSIIECTLYCDDCKKEIEERNEN
jgi:hypothetical protein